MSIQRRVLPGLLASLCIPAALWAAESGSASAGLTAAQIVDKHIAARGGLQAWHAVQTMSWSGKMDAGSGDSAERTARYLQQSWGHESQKARAAAAAQSAKAETAQQVQLPFLLEMKRPGKARVELEFAGKKAVQVYDGKQGWLMRPYLNRYDWEPFTAEQTKASAGKWNLDAPLFDYEAKGIHVALEGVDKVQGQDAYRLKLTSKDGNVQHIWIDRKSFLDVKVEGTPREMDGRMHTVWVTQGDFRSVQGLMVPFVLETAIDGYLDTHKMILEKVTLNAKLDDALFTKPGA